MARPRLDRFGLAILLSILNITIYCIAIAAAIHNLLSADFATIIINVYIIVLSLCLMVNELQAPLFVQEYFKFTCTYMGRGLVFFFLGCVVIRRRSFNLVAGIAAASFGVFYFILSFTPGPPPLLGIRHALRDRDTYHNEREAKRISRHATLLLAQRAQNALPKDQQPIEHRAERAAAVMQRPAVDATPLPADAAAHYRWTAAGFAREASLDGRAATPAAPTPPLFASSAADVLQSQISLPDMQALSPQQYPPSQTPSHRSPNVMQDTF